MGLLPGHSVPPLPGTQDNGQPFELRRGTWRVLFFFPSVATTHCQLQARRYQDLYAEFRALGVDVVGVNGDSRTHQVKFRNLCVLDYPLLEDRHLELTKAFGVMDEPWPGESVSRPRRETFLIDPEGVIVRHWTDVRPGEDAATVLEAARQLLA